MKVAIFSPYATVVPHFDTELDIAQQHLDAGDSVEFVNCLGGLSNCDANPSGDKSRCQQCIGRREMGLEMLQPFIRVTALTELNAAPPNLRTNFGSVAELVAYKIENFDIGYAAFSSLVSVCRDPEPDLVTHQDTLNRFLRSAYHTFFQAKKHFARNRPDRVYVFNGRFAALRAVLRAAQASNIDCFIHERGCDGEHYELFENHLPHDIPSIEALIRSRWEQAAKSPSREPVANQWYQDRANRVERNWHSFVKDQTAGKLPANWNANKHNVTIFCSSDDEFVAIGDGWKNELYPNQVTAIARIAKSVWQTDQNVHLHLRVHPNLTKVDNQRKREMLALNFPNLTVIPPESTIDSYEMLRASDSVASFGSTVGIEAVYWGRPSILLGPTFYQNLGGVYRAASHVEAVHHFTRPLATQAKTGALMYGFYWQTSGHPHQYFRSTGLFDGLFKGQTLYARPKKKTLVGRLHREARKLLLNLPRATKIG